MMTSTFQYALNVRKRNDEDGENKKEKKRKIKDKNKSYQRHGMHSKHIILVLKRNVNEHNNNNNKNNNTSKQKRKQISCVSLLCKCVVIRIPYHWPCDGGSRMCVSFPRRFLLLRLQSLVCFNLSNRHEKLKTRTYTIHAHLTLHNA